MIFVTVKLSETENVKIFIGSDFLHFQTQVSSILPAWLLLLKTQLTIVQLQKVYR